MPGNGPNLTCYPIACLFLLGPKLPQARIYPLMDDNSNNNPLFQQEFCLKQKLCLWAHVSTEAESLRKQKYAVIILLTHVLFRVNLITYV